jgi:hypothetical protein
MEFPIIDQLHPELKLFPSACQADSGFAERLNATVGQVIRETGIIKDL